MSVRPSAPPTAWYPLGDDARRTAIVGVGAVLGCAPMFVVFDDWTWLTQAIGAAFCVLAPAVLLRLRAIPRTWHLVPGLVLLLLYSTWLYASSDAILGLIPGPEVWQSLGGIRATAADQIAINTAPMESTQELRTFVVPSLGFFVAIIDWYAVVRRAPALAGVPLLALFTVTGAIGGTTVGWIPFTSAAIGFLIILSADSRISLMSWGRVIPRRSGDRVARARLGLSGRRIGVIAVIAAVAIPAVIPGLSRNLLADAFHGGGTGSGNGDGTSLSPFAALKGELSRGKSQTLAEVTVTPGATNPYFLRSKVLDRFTGSGWEASNGFSGVQVTNSVLKAALPPLGATTTFTATIKIKSLNDVAPLFGLPDQLTGLAPSWRYDPTTATLGGARTKANETYTERVVAPNPTPEQLGNAGNPGGISPTLTRLPSSIPGSVRSLVSSLTAGDTTPYDRALDLYKFYKEPANGFVYSLSTKAGDSSDDLVNFLQGRSGFCQQYAAALAVMFRIAGIPSRVVLGYTHTPPNGDGKFVVTSHDAHAWTEGYFQGFGWLPFNPTPLLGDNASRDVAVGYADPATAAPTTGALPGTGAAPSGNAQENKETLDPALISGGGTATVNQTEPLLPTWAIATLAGGVGAIVLLSVLPGLRVARRRSRFRTALQTGRLEPLWQELQATAVDTGTAWAPSTTPRQVPAWLHSRGVTSTAAVESLAAGVERERYARVSASGATTDATSDAIARVGTTGRAMRATMSRRARIRGWLVPASLLGRFRRSSRSGSD